MKRFRLFITVLLYIFAQNLGQNANATSANVQEAIATLNRLAAEQRLRSVTEIAHLHPDMTRLFPSRFRSLVVLQNLDAQVAMDAIHDYLFRETRARQICQLAGGNPATLANLFGIMTPNAERLTNVCAANVPVPGLVRFIPRWYQFVLHDDPNFPIESWTTTENSTILFFSGPITYEGLARRLIHEHSVQFDRHAFNTDAWYRNSIRAEFEPSTDACVIQKALAEPVVRMSLLLIRAFQMEDDILGTSVNVSLGEACSTRLRRTVELVQRMGDHLQLQWRYRMYNSPYMLKSEMCNDQRPITLDRALRVIETTILRSRRTKLESVLCDHLSIPSLEFGSDYLERKGPRPRIGGSGY